MFFINVIKVPTVHKYRYNQEHVKLDTLDFEPCRVEFQ